MRGSPCEASDPWSSPGAPRRFPFKGTMSLTVHSSASETPVAWIGVPFTKDQKGPKPPSHANHQETGHLTGATSLKPPPRVTVYRKHRSQGAGPQGNNQPPSHFENQTKHHCQSKNRKPRSGHRQKRRLERPDIGEKKETLRSGPFPPNRRNASKRPRRKVSASAKLSAAGLGQSQPTCNVFNVQK